jgi:hypothetical protein
MGEENSKGGNEAEDVLRYIPVDYLAFLFAKATDFR